MKYSELPIKFSGIYKIDFPNEKIYIGRAIDVKRRVWEHYTKEDRTPCYYALRKYFSTYEEIEVSLLEQVDNYEEIYEIERYWIKKYKSFIREIGYNITDGGDGAGCGIYNIASKFTEKDIDNIYTLLEEKRTNVYIASLYDVHPDTIGRINQGKTYFIKEKKYPIREGKGITEYKDKYNSFTCDQLDNAIYLLSTTQKNYKEITDITSISKSVLTSINLGKHPYTKKLNLSFPIRSNRRSIRLTKEDIKSIKEDLLNKEMSMKEIGNKHNCSSDTIGDINQGKRYSEDGENYPIRTFYPNRKIKKPVSTILGTEE